MTDAAAGDAVVFVVPALAVSLAAAAAVVAVVRRRGEPTPAPPVRWGGLDVVAVLLLYLTVQVCSGLAAAWAAGGPPPGEADGPAVVNAAALVAGGAATLLTTLLVIVAFRRAGASWRELGLASGRPAGDAVLALLTLVAITPPLLVLAGLLERIVHYHHPLLDYLAEHRDPGSLAIAAVSAVIAAPLAEEFFFRRLLQGWLERRMPRLAVPAAAVAFGAAHVGHGLAWLPLVLFGVAAGLLARQTGSLLAPILLHAGFNGIGLALATLGGR